MPLFLFNGETCLTLVSRGGMLAPNVQPVRS
jgi:hypothetical protein